MTKILYLVSASILILCSLPTVEAQTQTTVSDVERTVKAASPQLVPVPLVINGASDQALVTVTNTGAPTGGGAGVSGNAPQGFGVQGSGLVGVNGMGGANGTGVSGNSSGGGNGVVGQSVSGRGVVGTSNSGYGVYGETQGSAGKGVMGVNKNGDGVYGNGGEVGVYGEGTGPTSNGVFGKGANGVYGFSIAPNGAGVYALGSKYGVFAQSSDPDGFAAYLSGKVRTGDLSVNGSITANSCTGCSPPSDRDLKSNFSAVNPRFILDRLASVPVQMWRYKSEPDGVRHIGPVAQDFRAAFGLGDSDKTINTVDAQGVALAAIQGLYRMIEEKDKKIAELEQRVIRLERKGDRRREVRTRR